MRAALYAAYVTPLPLNLYSEAPIVDILPETWKAHFVVRWRDIRPLESSCLLFIIQKNGHNPCFLPSTLSFIALVTLVVLLSFVSIYSWGTVMKWPITCWPLSSSDDISFVASNRLVLLTSKTCSHIVLFWVKTYFSANLDGTWSKKSSHILKKKVLKLGIQYIIFLASTIELASFKITFSFTKTL